MLTCAALCCEKYLKRCRPPWEIFTLVYTTGLCYLSLPVCCSQCVSQHYSSAICSQSENTLFFSLFLQSSKAFKTIPIKNILLSNKDISSFPIIAAFLALLWPCCSSTLIAADIFLSGANNQTLMVLRRLIIFI